MDFDLLPDWLKPVLQGMQGFGEILMFEDGEGKNLLLRGGGMATLTRTRTPNGEMVTLGMTGETGPTLSVVNCEVRR